MLTNGVAKVMLGAKLIQGDGLVGLGLSGMQAKGAEQVYKLLFDLSQHFYPVP